MTASESPLAPPVLVLASRNDFTCDYVAAALARRGVAFLRLNSEDLPSCEITLDPVQPCATIRLGGRAFELSRQTLRSVLYRRPVYLRDFGDDRWSAQERFCRLQWAAFIQNLAVFDDARWYNAPAATYRAEHKAIQLREAHKLGMNVPPTAVTNTPLSAVDKIPGSRYAVKGLDTVMVREAGDEMFGFTTFADSSELSGPEWRTAPSMVQWAVPDKTDLRVTVLGERVFAVEILVDGHGVNDDWRLHKKQTAFVPHELPTLVASQCVEIVAALGLRFGAVDLALTGGDYYFLEINPTGEWAWLVDAAGLPIDEVFADELAQ